MQAPGRGGFCWGTGHLEGIPVWLQHAPTFYLVDRLEHVSSSGTPLHPISGAMLKSLEESGSPEKVGVNGSLHFEKSSKSIS